MVSSAPAPVRSRRGGPRSRLSGHPEWAYVASEFHRWLVDDDVDALAAHLLDPDPRFDIYREFSPLPQLWGTAEIRLWAADAAKQHHR